MSYSNPTWYGVGNVGAFSKSFEKTFNTQFKSANDYYEAKAQEIEEYNNNLENKAEEQRKELLKGKEITPQILADVESQVQKFLKEGRTFKEGEGFFGAPQVQKKTKAEMDKAAASFTGRVGVMNELLDNAISGKLQPKRDLDRGSATYLEYTKVMNAIKEDASNVKFEYKGNNEYDFTVTYKDKEGKSKTVNSDDLKSMIELNDPEVRKLIDKNFDEASTSMLGLTKTAFSKRIAEGEIKRNPRTGVAYVPEEDVDIIVREQVGMMKPQTVNDYFNNEIDFDDKKRLEVLSKTEGGQKLIDLVDKTEGNASNEALSILLDIPEGDIKSRDAAFKKLGISAEQANEYSEILKKYRTEAVAERFKDELKSKGLQSKYFAPQRYTTSSRGRGSYRRSGEGSTSKATEVDERAGQAVREAMGIAGINKPFASSLDKPQAFTPGFIRVGKDKKDVSSVKIDANGVAIVGYTFGSPYQAEEKDKDGNTRTVTKQRQKYKKYDTKDPVSIKDMYRDMSESFTTEGFEQEMISKYTNLEGLKDLNKPGMQKWVDWLLKTGPKYYDENEFKDMLITHVAITGLSNDANSIASWQKFYLENKDIIDIRRSKLSKNQQASTGPNMIGAGTTLSGITLN